MVDSIGNELIIAFGLLAGLICSLEAGYRLGRKAAHEGESPTSGQVGAIQGAILGLLGLLLGFSFSGAASRFLEKQDLILQEANAIGTVYLRADLLDEPYASQIRSTLADYVRHRLDASKRLGASSDAQPLAALESDVAKFHAQLWAAARDGVRAKPATTAVVLDAVNLVIDLHTTRVTAGQKRLPGFVLALLVLCSMLGMAAIGYGCGLAGRRDLPMTLSLVILFAAALWTTIDLDYPRAGLIRLSDAPLEKLDLQGP